MLSAQSFAKERAAMAGSAIVAAFPAISGEDIAILTAHGIRSVAQLTELLEMPEDRICITLRAARWRPEHTAELRRAVRMARIVRAGVYS